MRGYNDGFDACSDGIGDDNNAENNNVDGNLRVIATLDMVINIGVAEPSIFGSMFNQN
ncbi:MAG: hypothetical protein WA941_01420 [Nitrososphaeraceae archaeon]